MTTVPLTDRAIVVTEGDDTYHVVNQPPLATPTR